MNSRENKLLNYDTLHTVLQRFFSLPLSLDYTCIDINDYGFFFDANWEMNGHKEVNTLSKAAQKDTSKRLNSGKGVKLKFHWQT